MRQCAEIHQKHRQRHCQRFHFHPDGGKCEGYSWLFRPRLCG
ncbi:MAG: hypothetical protein IKQ62_07160 [Bacteroidaceae bacterium]|nr:hypothetical protein [Bacteroidaceae bacterium]